MSHAEKARMPGSAADMSSPKLTAMYVRLMQRRRNFVPVSHSNDALIATASVCWYSVDK